MTAIWPAGPPKLSAATRAQDATASRNEIPCAGNVPCSVPIASTSAPRRDPLSSSPPRSCRTPRAALGELHGIIVRPEMHEEHARLFVQHVAVDRRHLDAVRAQRA